MHCSFEFSLPFSVHYHCHYHYHFWFFVWSFQGINVGFLSYHTAFLTCLNSIYCYRTISNM